MIKPVAQKAGDVEKARAQKPVTWKAARSLAEVPVALTSSVPCWVEVCLADGSFAYTLDTLNWRFSLKKTKNEVIEINLKTLSLLVHAGFLFVAGNHKFS